MNLTDNKFGSKHGSSLCFSSFSFFYFYPFCCVIFLAEHAHIFIGKMCCCDKLFVFVCFSVCLLIGLFIILKEKGLQLIAYCFSFSFSFLLLDFSYSLLPYSSA